MHKNYRVQIIKDIIRKLDLIKEKPSDSYPIEANRKFLQSLKSLYSYVKWFIKEAPKIDDSRLLELTDFSLPEWDLVMHKKLIEIEGKKNPGLIEPLVKKITRKILDGKLPMNIMNLGCGGMETERQVIERLIKKQHGNPVTFIGVDKSAVAEKLVKENFNKLSQFVEIHKVDELNFEKLVFLNKNKTKRYLIILANKDIFELSNIFPQKYLDVVFHCLFKHHLGKEKKKSLEDLAKNLGKIVIEYDGYKSWLNMIPQTMAGWSNPIFLNAEIFSNLRFSNKSDIIEAYKNQEIIFTKAGYYLVEFSQDVAIPKY